MSMDIKNKLEEEILSFIKERFANDNNWLTGNCYWFSQILCLRFHLQCFYQPIKGHFISGDGNCFFDWTGKVTDIEDDRPILYNDICEKDPIWAARLYRDCIK